MTIPERTRNAIKHKYGRESAPKVAERYHVSVRTVWNIWNEAEEGIGKKHPWKLSWLRDPSGPDDNINQLLRAVWYQKHGHQHFIKKYDGDTQALLEIVYYWDKIPLEAKQQMIGILGEAAEGIPREWPKEDVPVHGELAREDRLLRDRTERREEIHHFKTCTALLNIMANAFKRKYKNKSRVVYREPFLLIWEEYLGTLTDLDFNQEYQALRDGGDLKNPRIRT